MIKRGDKDIKAAYRGDKAVKAIYRGTTLRWQAPQKFVGFKGTAIGPISCYINQSIWLRPVVKDDGTFEQSLDGIELASFRDMFCDQTLITSLTFYDVDTSKVTDMAHMFESCSRLASLDISCFDMSNVKYGRMFEMNLALTSLRFGKNCKVDLNLSDLPLDRESALSVINGLAQVSTTKQLILSFKTYSALSSQDRALATSKGWFIPDPQGAGGV